MRLSAASSAAAERLSNERVTPGNASDVTVACLDGAGRTAANLFPAGGSHAFAAFRRCRIRFRRELRLEEIAGCLSKPFACTRQHRHNRAHRHAHHIGDLLVGKTFQLAQDEDLPESNRKPAQRAFDEASVSLLQQQLFRIRCLSAAGMYLFVELGGGLKRTYL